MRSLKALALATGLIAMTVTTCTIVITRPHSDTRSAGPPQQLAGMMPILEYSRADSTGLFVGVQTFRHDPQLFVPYAVDDAVDLAWKFALDPRVSLVPPRRVVLALSGTPQKNESKERLSELRAAGARIENASSGDIFSLLKEQTARAGRRGLLVFSLATHGFLNKNGEAYILGSTSTMGSAATSLPTEILFDIAGQTARSIIFVDACRDRAGQTSRGAGPDPTTAAPVRRMKNIRGQAIFYAAAQGEYAYDDDVNRNGVFTKAVLDGMNCGASAPRGTVNVDTLNTYVEREVRRWIQENKNRSVNPATQVSMEGATRNMPLAECWRAPGRCSRASVDGSTITVYDDQTQPLWHKDLGEPIVHSEVADLDADALCEVVVGFRDKITVFNRDGRPLWSRNASLGTLRNFTTGDLFRKHKQQVIALWNDKPSSVSSLTVIDGAGRELSHLEHAGLLQHVAIGRETNMHSPRVAVATANSLLLLDPKKLHARAPYWHLSLVGTGDAVQDLRIADNGDSRREIVVTTTSGTTWISFDGKILRREPKGDAAPQWIDAPLRKRRGK